MIDPDQYDGFATPEELNLTPEEIQNLRQNKRQLTAYAQQKLRKLKAKQQAEKIEEIKAQLKVLEKKLSFLEELSQTKSPVEEAFKDWMGVYPPTTPSVDGIDDIRWRAFQMGYNSSKEKKVSESFQAGYEFAYQQNVSEWNEKEMIRQNLKTSLKELANGDVRPIDDVIEEAKEQQTKSPVEECYKDWWGQYPETGTWDSFDDKRWQGFQAGYEFAYAISTAKEVMEKVQEEQNVVDEPDYYDKVEWDEKDNPNENPLDYVKPQTPEQKEAFREAIKQAIEQGIILEVKQPTDELVDKLTKNPPSFLKFELGKTLEDICMRWWGDIFTTHSDWDCDTCIDDLIDQVELFLPREQSAEGSQDIYAVAAVEGFNDAIKKIKSKLRNKEDT